MMITRTLFRHAAVVWSTGLVVLLTAGACMAQGPITPAHLMDKETEDELNLTAEQRAASKKVLEAVLERHKEKLKKALSPAVIKPSERGPSEDDESEARMKFHEAMKVSLAVSEDTMKDLEKVLSAEQSKRYNELMLQSLGVNGLLMSHVSTKIELTKEQVEKIMKIHERVIKSAQKVVTEAFKEAKGDFKKAQELADEKLQKLHDDSKNEAEKLLSDKQSVAWKELIGKPFTSKQQKK